MWEEYLDAVLEQQMRLTQVPLRASGNYPMQRITMISRLAAKSILQFRLAARLMKLKTHMTQRAVYSMALCFFPVLRRGRKKPSGRKPSGLIINCTDIFAAIGMVINQRTGTRAGIRGTRAPMLLTTLLQTVGRRTMTLMNMVYNRSSWVQSMR